MPLRITEDQLRQLKGGKRIKGSAPGLVVPQEPLGARDPAGYAAVHHLASEVPCRRCGAASVLLVQCYGKNPTAIGEPVCLGCGQQEKQSGKVPRSRRRHGHLG